MRVLGPVLVAAMLGGPVAAQTRDGRETVDCLIEARTLIEIVSQDEGLIAAIPVGRGDTVSRGDLLVQMEDTLERLQVELAATRAASDLEVRAQQTRLALRQREYDRTAQLVERNAATSATLEDAEIELQLTEFALEEARLARALAELEHRQALALVDRKKITSPIDGIVLRVDSAPGEFATEQTEILTLAEIDPLHVEVFAPAELYGRIGVGETYTVSLVPPLSGTFEAETTVVDRVLDSASGTFGVRLRIDNPDGGVPAGARCVVAFGAS